MKTPSDAMRNAHRDPTDSNVSPETRFPPRLTTDCHTHVAGDGVAIPFVSPRAYTPCVASPQDIVRMMDRAGIARVVIVQMSVYGTDNRYLYARKADVRRTLRSFTSGKVVDLQGRRMPICAS